MRRELIRSDRPQFAGEDGFRFRHLLIRDTAYDALPKTTRAELHRRFAAWLETHGQGLVELEEISGYHLEQAARYLVDLGRPDAELADAAAERLWSAGRRAVWRVDRRAARSLLERAAALCDQPPTHLLIDLARTFDHPPAAASLLDEVAERARREGDAASAALAQALAAYHRTHLTEGSADEQERLALAAVPLLEAAGDHDGLCEIWFTLANGVYNIRCRYDQIEHASEEALRHAALAGQRRTHLFLLPMALRAGARPVDEALARLVELTSAHLDDPSDRAILLAMRGDFDEARALVDVAVSRFDELGMPVGHAYVAEYERLVGNDEAAAAQLAVYCAYLADHEQTSLLSTYAPLRGRHLCSLGRFDEAERLAEQGRELGHADDPVTQALWRRVLALVLAHRGDLIEAQRLVREAVVIAQTTDSPWYQGEGLCDLAEVLETAGRHDAAVVAYLQALELYDQKGIIPLARRTRERLAALQSPTA